MENKDNLTQKQEEHKPKHRDKLEALDNLSLGISIVVAVGLGTGFGILLKNLTGYSWLLWLGVFWGVAAAFMNVYRAYKRAQAQFKDLENDPRYAHRAKYGDKSNDDD